MSMWRSSLKNLFSRPYTVRYPKEGTGIPANNRGRVMWDMQKCIWCSLCMRNCPGRAIVMDKTAKTQTITRVRCIQCRVCVDICPTKTISIFPEYSAAGPEREVHVFSVEGEPFSYRVEHMPRSERNEGRLRKRREG